ncbi:MAG TPA: glycosyltransferase family 2 protein, partial [Saprospiraceae bacterium]|nr:glycosyltransferase family 2 protein [Saprospiraceae bacterium]
VVLGSRILGMGARKGGMPLYKYVANRFLTFAQNFLINYKLSEYHTGYRAFSREVLETIDFNRNSDDFVFDNEMLSQIVYAGFDIGEVTCPTKYFDEASSINFRRSMKYGLGVLRVSFNHFLQRLGVVNLKIYRRMKP